MHVNDVFFCEEVSVSVSGQSCWSFALFAFFSARLLQLFIRLFSLAKKKIKTIRSSLDKRTQSTIINTQTTKMPSEEQQLPEPLLDDGGNDRFVLFPLKYDAVWEMVRRRRRRRLLRKKNIFEKSSAF